MNLESFGKIIIGAAVFLFLFGLAVFLLGKIAGVPRLPGDIFYKKGNTSISFPIVTSIVVSIVLTVVLNIVLYLFRR